MTALVLLALAWAVLAVSTAFVIGHGIRLADTSRPARSGRDDTWLDEGQALRAA